MPDENEEIQGPPLAPAGTPVLRADALDDDPQDDPEDSPDEPESPVEAPEAPAEGDDTHVHADGGGISSYSPLDGPREPELLSCPICGSETTCGHNLPYTPKR